MTIIEKVMKAWLDGKTIEVVPEVGTFQSPGEGEVIEVSPGKTLFTIWSAEQRSRLEYRFDDIADIRFVDEKGEDGDKECPTYGGSCIRGECTHSEVCRHYHLDPSTQEPEPEWWDVDDHIEGYDHINRVIRVVGSDEVVLSFKDEDAVQTDIRDRRIRLMSSAPQMRDALKMVAGKIVVRQPASGVEIEARFNQDEYGIIMDALEKAEIE